MKKAKIVQNTLKTMRKKARVRIMARKMRGARRISAKKKRLLTVSK